MGGMDQSDFSSEALSFKILTGTRDYSFWDATLLSSSEPPKKFHVVHDVCEISPSVMILWL